MVGVSDQNAYRLVDQPQDAEVIVVNTCGFIDAAKQESIDTLLEMAQHKKTGRCHTLVAAGCLSQRYSDDLAQGMPEVDFFLGTGDMLKLATALTRTSHTPRVMVGHPAAYTMNAADPRRLSEQPFSAYLKIAEGCSRQCSFCAIPSFRGTQRSRSIADLVLEATRLVEHGVREVNIISQDTIAYGRDLPGRPKLAELVAALVDIPDLKWLRLFYLYPERLDEALIELLAQHPKVVPYVDMPLQHASDAMLRRMKRGHGGVRLRNVVDRLRKSIGDNLTLRSAFIVGHPGESVADFEELCTFVKWAEFDRLGVFNYSAEEGTTSFDMADPVPDAIREERYYALLEIQREISQRKLQRYVGQTLEVLVEGLSEESDLLWQGRHAGQAPEIDGKVMLAVPPSGKLLPGEFRKARITHAADYDLIGRILATQERAPTSTKRTRTRLKVLENTP